MNDTNNWLNCPKCGSDQIEGDSVDIEGTHARQRVWCLECSASWTEVYQASHREQEGTISH